MPPGHERAAIDWEAVEREYRAGQLSVREIGKVYGVSHVTIIRKAKTLGWVQNLSQRVREAATTKLATIEATSGNAKQAVEEAAARVVQVIREHRVKIARGIKITDGLFGELEGAELGTSLKDKSVILGNLAGSLKTFIGLERQAFNLSDGEAGNGVPEIVSKQQRDAAVKAALRADT